MEPVSINQQWWYFQFYDVKTGIGMFVNLGVSKQEELNVDFADYLISVVDGTNVRGNQKDDGMLGSYDVSDPLHKKFGRQFSIDFDETGAIIRGKEKKMAIAYELRYDAVMRCEEWFETPGARETDTIMYQPTFAMASVNGWIEIDGTRHEIENAPGYHDQDHGTISALQYQPWIMARDESRNLFFTHFSMPGKTPVSIACIDGTWMKTNQSLPIISGEKISNDGFTRPETYIINAVFGEKSIQVTAEPGAFPSYIDLGFGSSTCKVMRDITPVISGSMKENGNEITLDLAGEFDWWDQMYDYSSEINNI